MRRPRSTVRRSTKRGQGHCQNSPTDSLQFHESRIRAIRAKSGHPECKGYTGAYLAIPKFGVCIDVRQTDTLAMDVHQYHANTEMKGDGRLSVVCYLRQKMINCMKT